MGLVQTKTYLIRGQCGGQGIANVEAIGTLVRLGAKVEPVLSFKNVESPLHVAARCGRVDVVEDLVKAGVPVTVKTKASLVTYV